MVIADADAFDTITEPGRNGVFRMDAYASVIQRPDPGLDSLTKSAAGMLNMPISQITLISARRQTLLSRAGLLSRRQVDCVTTPFCTEAVRSPDGLLVIRDASLDPRFAEAEPEAGFPRIRCYAGVPLLGRKGLPLGTLSVLDIEPHDFTVSQLELLRELGCAASAILEHHRYEREGADGQNTGDAGQGFPIAWTCRESGTIAEMGPDFALLLNTERGGGSGQDWILVAHAMEREAIRTRWAESVRQGVPFEAEFRSNDQAGLVGWMRARVMPPDSTGPTQGLWRGLLRRVSLDRRNALRSEYFSSHDVLTGLLNRFGFQTRLAHAIDDARHGRPFALFCLDLDDFKLINDSLGHQSGDNLLRGVANRLRACVRHDDVVARLGGDEFVIIQPGASRPSDVALLAQRLNGELRAPMQIDGQVVIVNASIGIALCPRDGSQSELLLRNADMALYLAKSEGRGVFRFFKPTMDAATTSRRAMKFDLRHALERQELSLMFQPIVSMIGGRASSVEALLRWRHPVRGAVSPVNFIPVLESAGLLGSVGPWVLRQACLAAAGWPDDLRISVNLSPTQFETGDIFETVASTLQETRLDAARLELEITETLPLLTSKRNLETLRKLRQLGVRTVLDDFGTGYSSLTYLRTFRFDKIKLDRAFTASMSQKDGMAIARAVIGLAHDLGIEVTAEGVETREQFDRVRSEGCNEVQGYFLARPMRAARIPSGLRAIEESLRTQTVSGRPH